MKRAIIMVIDSMGIGVMPIRSLKRRIARRGPDVITRKPTTKTTTSVASIIQIMRPLNVVQPRHHKENISAVDCKMTY